MIWALVKANWQLAIAALAIGAILLLWNADRKSQFSLGVATANAKFHETIERSKGLVRNEKDAAIAAASAAARDVCERAGLDPADCEDL